VFIPAEFVGMIDGVQQPELALLKNDTLFFSKVEDARSQMFARVRKVGKNLLL
jgi:hypothetical protein